MKVALIATEKLPVPAVRGGAIQIYLDAVSKVMVTQGHDVTVISITDPTLATREQQDGIRYIRFNEDVYVTEIEAHVKSENYDVVHICNRPKWMKRMKDAAPSTQFVLSVHNEMFAYEKITDKAGEECLAAIAQVVTVSDYIGETIVSRFPSAKGKVRTVYSGVDLSTYHPAWTPEGKQLREQVREELGFQRKKIALFVGRLSKVKGPHILLQALPEIIKKYPDVMLVFIGSKWFGDNNVNNYVRHLYTLGSTLQNNVSFIKFVQPKNIPTLYAMSDVFVCSSQWEEPLARVHYEAMAAGLPIITSRRGGNPEVIDLGQNGYVIDDFENPSAYAEKLIELFGDDAKREQFGRYGRQKVEAGFGWSRVAMNLLDTYEAALKRGEEG